MEQLFFFLFGMTAGMAVLPHLQRLVSNVKRRLAELDQPTDSSPRR
jgi:hypothetical protein